MLLRDEIELNPKKITNQPTQQMTPGRIHAEVSSSGADLAWSRLRSV